MRFPLFHSRGPGDMFETWNQLYVLPSYVASFSALLFFPPILAVAYSGALYHKFQPHPARRPWVSIQFPSCVVSVWHFRVSLNRAAWSHGCPCPLQGSQTRWPLKAPSIPNQPVVLCALIGKPVVLFCCLISHVKLLFSSLMAHN